MDMSKAYEHEMRPYCPQAAIVYNLFHGVVKFAREVIDRMYINVTNWSRGLMGLQSTPNRR